MIDKIVLYTIEKKSRRQIKMVLICRDSAEKNSGLVQVIFGAIKPNSSRLDLLHFERIPIDTKNYLLISMDLHLNNRIRHTVFGGLNQLTCWEKVSNLADRFIMGVNRVASHTFSRKSSSSYKKSDTLITGLYKPPIAVLVTNSDSLKNSLKKRCTGSKKNE